MDGTPSSCHGQSPDGPLRCGTNIWSGSLTLAICVFCIAWCPLRDVAAAAYDQDMVSPSTPGSLGGSGPGVLGSRFGVIQRRDITNKQLLHSAPDATTTAFPDDNPLTTNNDETMATLDTSGSGGDVHNSFLSRVTPPHWTTVDPWPTDPARTPTTTTPAKASTTQQTTTRPTTPAIRYASTSTTHFSSQQHEVQHTSPAISSYHQTSGKELQFRDEGDYPRSTTYTESNWSAGTTEYIYTPIASKVGKYSTVKEGLNRSNGTGSNDSSGNSSEPAWVADIGRRIVFPALLMVSWIFTSVALILHILVPGLRANMGQILMCYIFALWLKCIITPSSLFLMLCAPDFTNKKDVCTVMAFVSYMMSMAYRFWLNIMCFDIWRKVRNLNRMKHVQPVRLWFYHLYGWGMPALFGLMALLIREFGPEYFIRPGFNTDKGCWFDHAADVHQMLYMNLPGGLLHIANMIFMMQTRHYCTLMQQTSISDNQESNNNTQGRIHTTTNYINEFNLQFRIMYYMVIMWVLWSISSAIHWLTELWHFLVIPGFLISLQGVIVFLIFIFNKNKRQLVQRRFPFLKFDICCKVNNQSLLRQCSTSISETTSDKRKKMSVISITSITSLFSSQSYNLPIEEANRHMPVREVSSVSSSYNSAEGGSVQLNLSQNRAQSLPPIEDTQSLCHVEGSLELNLDPTNLILPQSLSCTSHQPNTVMDENPVIVPVSRTFDEKTEVYVNHQHI